MPLWYVFRLGWMVARSHPGALVLEGPKSPAYALGYFCAQIWNRIAGAISEDQTK